MPGLPSPSSSTMRGSFGSVGSGSLAGSSSRMPTGVGVAGRTIRRAPSSPVTSTGVLTGLMACVAASEMDVVIGWLLTWSAWQNSSDSISWSPSTAKSVNP